jgi:hypothetical protein
MSPERLNQAGKVLMLCKTTKTDMVEPEKLIITLHRIITIIIIISF